jgi:acetolactate synthase-1/2/3 large subunit
MTTNGADALIQALENQGVEVVFGYPGGQVIPEFDAFMRHGKMPLILVRHEQGAAHAADGYARATGKTGVCLATSGPGATNLITGIANAYLDSIPMVAFTGQVPTQFIGTDFFQEADIYGITLPVTKHNYLVKDVRDLPEVIKEAFHIASTGRPGPVVIDVPGDVARAEIKGSTIDWDSPPKLPGYKPTYKGHARQINQAVQAIALAKRPLLYVGGGVITSGASEELRELAELTQIPVTWTLMGKGAFPDTHPLNMGMPGMHGTRYANHSLCDCDLLIAVGVRFDDRVTGKLAGFSGGSKKIHIDIDPAEIGKNVEIDIPIVGDAKNILRGILAGLKKTEGFQPRTGEWLEVIADWKRRYPLAYDQGDVIKPEFVVEQICETTKDRPTVIATEVGQNQMWAAQYYRSTEPRTFISSGGLGTMGFGLPAAIGAKFGRPDALVIDIAGDGSIQMNSQEFATAVANKLDLKVAILNNGYLGMVRQWQELFWDKRYSGTDLRVGTPDFVKLAEAYGATGIRVERPEDVRKALTKAYRTPGVVVLDFMVEREENVYPMVAPGAAIGDMMGGPEIDPDVIAADA